MEQEQDEIVITNLGFAYSPFLHFISVGYLPYRSQESLIHNVENSLNHEYVHRVLSRIEGLSTSISFDYLTPTIRTNNLFFHNNIDFLLNHSHNL